MAIDIVARAMAANASGSSAVTSVNGKTGEVVLIPLDLGISVSAGAKGGLSFNEYNTLINYSKNGGIFGGNSQLGVKGYHITATNPQSGVPTLDITVSETIAEGELSAGNRIYLALDHHSFDEFEVVSTTDHKIYLTLISGTSYDTTYFNLDTPIETSVKNYAYAYTYNSATGVYTLLNTGVILDDKTEYSYSFGKNNKNAGRYSFIVGNNNFAPSWYNTIFGHDNTGGYGCFVTGAENKGGNYSIVAGQQNNGEISLGSIVCGYQNTDKGFYNLIGGRNNTITYNNTTVSGVGLTSGKNSQAVFGEYNLPVTEGALVIGNGSRSDNRGNAMVVYTDGHAEVSTYGASNLSVVRKQELDDTKFNLSRNYFYKAHPAIFTNENVNISTKYDNLFNITKATINNPAYSYISFDTSNVPVFKRMIFTVKFNSFDDTSEIKEACGLVFNIQMDNDKYQIQFRHSGLIYITKNNTAVTGYPVISGGLNTDTLYDIYLVSNHMSPHSLELSIKNRMTGVELATWTDMDSAMSFEAFGISPRYCTADVNAEIYDANDYGLRNHY